jgi:hypothetical protein
MTKPQLTVRVVVGGSSPTRTLHPFWVTSGWVIRPLAERSIRIGQSVTQPFINSQDATLGLAVIRLLPARLKERLCVLYS